MPKKYTKEEYWELYKKLPQELKDALFDEETGDNIYEICKRNEIEENLEAIVDCVGNVLLGLLPPEDFQKTLEKELSMEEAVAKKIAQEINRFVFYPVKPALEQLYKTGVAPTEIEEPSFVETTEGKEKQTKPAREDIYKEPIE